MKKWKIIRNITITYLILNILFIIYTGINCILMEYPQELLGVTIYNWTNLFVAYLYFIFMIGIIPLIIDIILLILSIIKIKKFKFQEEN